jgi:GAF domain-containing protein
VTGPPDIRFYAGAPLVTASGLRLGSLCVIDCEPRELDAEQLNVLCNFAEVVVREIEKDAARVRPAARAARRAQLARAPLARAAQACRAGPPACPQLSVPRAPCRHARAESPARPQSLRPARG